MQSYKRVNNVVLGMLLLSTISPLNPQLQIVIYNRYFFKICTVKLTYCVTHKYLQMINYCNQTIATDDSQKAYAKG